MEPARCSYPAISAISACWKSASENSLRSAAARTTPNARADHGVGKLRASSSRRSASDSHARTSVGFILTLLDSSVTLPPGLSDNMGDADHRVACHESGERVFVELVRSGRTLRQYQIADLRDRIPDPYLDFRLEHQAHFTEHATRLSHEPRTVCARLVPGRRQSEDRPRVARAKRAHHHVMHGRRILDDVKHLGFRASDTELGTRGETVGEQSCLEGRIGPGFCDHAGAIFRTDCLFVVPDDLVDARRLEHRDLAEQAFYRFRADCLPGLFLEGVMRHVLSPSKGSRWSSLKSLWVKTLGSACGPHNSRASNRTL